MKTVAKKLLSAIAHFLAFPLLMIATAVFLGPMLHSNIAAIAVIAGLLCISVLTKPSWDGYMVQFRTLLALVTAGIIVFTYLHQLSINMLPWGIIGWTVYMVVSVILIVYVIITHDENRPKHYHRSKLVGLLSIVAVASQLYLFFGTQYIWLPVAGGLALSMVQAESAQDFLDGIFDEHQFPLCGGSILVGIVSTIYQFWSTPLIADYDLRAILIMLWILIAIGVAIYWTYQGIKYLIGIPKRIKDRHEETVRMQAQKEEQARQKEENIQKQKALLEKLSGSEQPLWADILEAKHLGAREIDHEIVAKTNFLELIEFSEFKKQLHYDHGNMITALDLLKVVFDTSFADSILKPMHDQCKKLAEYKDYKGYKALKKLMDYRLNGYVLLPASNEDAVAA